MLHLTSFTFASVVLHAHFAQDHILHAVMLAVLALSISFHTAQTAQAPGATACCVPGQRIIAALDKGAAHILFALVVLRERAVTWRLSVPLAAAALWIAEGLWPVRANQLHACLHLLTVAGLHALLWLDA